MEPEHEQQHPAHPAHEKNFHPPKPFWRHVHTHWGFWVAVFFLFAALLIYIFSYDLVLVPHRH